MCRIFKVSEACLQVFGNIDVCVTMCVCIKNICQLIRSNPIDYFCGRLNKHGQFLCADVKLRNEPPSHSFGRGALLVQLRAFS